MPDLKVPTNATEITAEWMTSILEPAYPGTIVESVHLGSIIHGTATKIRLLLTYNEEGHKHRLPPTMWFKGGFEEHSGHADLMAVYNGEASFFRYLAGDLDIGCPKCYGTIIDPETGRSCILLEDLLSQNATFGHASKPASPEQAAAVLSFLAKLHGRYWQRTAELDQYDWLKGGGALLGGGVTAKQFEPENWNTCMKLPRAEFVTGPLRDRERIGKLMLHMLSTDVANAQCLAHGDPHLGNTFMNPDGRVSYLDWQTIMLGYWAFDVAYFMTTALTVADRRHAERDLIAHYCKELGEEDIALPFDLAWLQYRRHSLYNLAWGAGTPGWQPEEVYCINSERAFAAALDLDMLGAWEEPWTE
jgi:hypothetical protein